jgi:hypothetical protein
MLDAGACTVLRAFGRSIERHPPSAKHLEPWLSATPGIRFTFGIRPASRYGAPVNARHAEVSLQPTQRCFPAAAPQSEGVRPIAPARSRPAPRPRSGHREQGRKWHEAARCHRTEGMVASTGGGLRGLHRRTRSAVANAARAGCSVLGEPTWRPGAPQCTCRRTPQEASFLDRCQRNSRALMVVVSVSDVEWSRPIWFHVLARVCMSRDRRNGNH